MKAHRLSLTTRDRTPRLKSLLTALAGAGIRATATFGVAAAALVPVGDAPALAVISCPGGDRDEHGKRDDDDDDDD